MSSRILSYFNYDAKKSLIHHIDPRNKILFIISMTCLILYFDDIIPLLFIFAFMLPFIFLANFFVKWLRALLFLVPLLILILILNSFLLTDITSPTTAGLVLALRVIILSSVFGLFFQTVSPDDLSNMLIKLKFPYSFAWSISTAYRFIPTLAKETSIITAAQKARGLQIDRGNIFKRVRNMIPLLIPIFASALRRSWQLAEAIESRGWNAVKKRTFLYTIKFKWWDYLIMIFSLALFAVFLLLIIKQYELPIWMQWQIPANFEIKYLLTKLWLWAKGLFN